MRVEDKRKAEDNGDEYEEEDNTPEEDEEGEQGKTSSFQAECGDKTYSF